MSRISNEFYEGFGVYQGDNMASLIADEFMAMSLARRYFMESSVTKYTMWGGCMDGMCRATWHAGGRCGVTSSHEDMQETNIKWKSSRLSYYSCKFEVCRFAIHRFLLIHFRCSLLVKRI